MTNQLSVVVGVVAGVDDRVVARVVVGVVVGVGVELRLWLLKLAAAADVRVQR